jgi:hypothetical protein
VSRPTATALQWRIQRFPLASWLFAVSVHIPSQTAHCTALMLLATVEGGAALLAPVQDDRVRIVWRPVFDNYGPHAAAISRPSERSCSIRAASTPTRTLSASLAQELLHALADVDGTRATAEEIARVASGTR